MNMELKEVLDKYKINIDDFFENMKKIVDANTDCYPGLTPRESKSLYKEISQYYSTKNKTNKSFLPLKEYYEYSVKSEIYYKTEEPEVNQILEGGFRSGYIYQLIGPTETGKTTLMNSVVKANINNKNIKIIYFSFLYYNIDYELEKHSDKNSNSNFTIIIFDPFTIILHQRINLELTLISDFDEIINELSWKNNICVIFGIYARKLNDTFWHYENDQKQIERLILRNYENNQLFEHFPNCVKVYLYKMQKRKVLKYYMKVVSSNFYKSSNFIEWELAE